MTGPRDDSSSYQPRTRWTRRQFMGALLSSVVYVACGDDGSSAPTPDMTTGDMGTDAAPDMLVDDTLDLAIDMTPPPPPIDAPMVPALTSEPFTLGVASGDPLPDSVILWTRLAMQPLEGGGMPDDVVPVVWEVATDDTFNTRLGEGIVEASPDFAHSLHINVSGLQPATTYWYRFRTDRYTSPIGRTRTAPAPDDSSARMRLITASCQNYTAGFYTAHRYLAQEPLIDLVLFLGDYIYEGGGREVREHNSSEVRDLAGYRNRYALYKLDADLQAAHAAHPWVVTWDDHEVENNYANSTAEAGSQEFGDMDAFLTRREAAYRAFYEHMPIRVEPPSGPDLRIYRQFNFGNLLEIFVLDTRQYRSDQPCDDGFLCDDLNDPNATLLGTEQRDWLLERLGASSAQWNVLAQQVVMAPLTFNGVAINPDQWDGYNVERQQIAEFLASQSVSNPIVLTGDIHSSIVGVVRREPLNPESAIVATEFVATSISSNGLELGGGDVLANIVEDLPDVFFFDAERRGYLVHEITPDYWRAEFRIVSTVKEPDGTLETAQVWMQPAGGGEPMRES